MPHSIVKVNKKKIKLENFKASYNSDDKIKLREFIKASVYVLLIFIIWFYFLKVNIESTLILLKQNFGTPSIKLFLLWLSSISIIGFGHFLYANIIKPFLRKYRIPVEYFNPSNDIIKKNELNQLFLFTSQLIYLFIFYPLYIPYTNIVTIEAKLRIFYGFLIAGFVVSIHYAAIIVYRFLLNLKIKKKFLVFSYATLQSLNIQSENYQLIIKMISDIETSKNISFGLITKIVSSMTFFFAIIPNIIFTI